MYIKTILLTRAKTVLDNYLSLPPFVLKSALNKVDAICMIISSLQVSAEIEQDVLAEIKAAIDYAEIFYIDIKEVLETTREIFNKNLEKPDVLS